MDKQREVNPILFARMPAAAQGMDEVNPDQVDRELAHKAGVKQNKENAKAFLFLAQECLNGMDEQREVNPILFARMPAAAQGMDKVNPDQVDMELAHKAGVKQNKENAKAFLFLAQVSLNGMDEVNPSANPISSNMVIEIENINVLLI